MDTIEQLFEGTGHAPTFEQVFGDKSAQRTPKVCCVTGIRIRKGDAWTRHSLGNGYSVFALRRATPERLAALAALIPSTPAAKTAKAVKETDNG
jgi:hypothetical protein